MSHILEYQGYNDQDGPSPRIWGNLPQSEIDSRPGRIIHIFDRFDALGPHASASSSTVTEKNGPWSTFISQGGSITAASASVPGGGITVSADGDDEGVVLTRWLPLFKIAYGGKPFWFEARVKSSTVANTKHGIFVGMINAITPSATVPIAADGTLADQNLVGFHRLEGDGDAIDTVYKANGVTQVTVKADAIALAADTYVKLGMYFDGTTLFFFKDGVLLPDSKVIPSAAGTDFPNDVTLSPVFAVLNATGTDPGSATFQWVRVAQLL